MSVQSLKKIGQKLLNIEHEQNSDVDQGPQVY